MLRLPTVPIAAAFFVFWGWALALAASAQPSRVMVPSLDLDARGQPVMLVGHWSAAPDLASDPARSPGLRGAMLLLHGCGGPYGASGALSVRMREYTELLRQRGWAVLVLDSLTTRGERELCTQPLGRRKITQTHRRLDAWGALVWLSRQPGIDPSRLGLLGWSHGGSAVLASIDAERLSGRPPGVPMPAMAVAYYPGCAETLRASRVVGVPLLMQLGQADDWTPAQPCIDWAHRANAEARDPSEPGRGPRSSPIEVALHPGAYHGFDGQAPLRLRQDVPNGVNPGQGVHVGGNEPARRASLLRLEQWLARWNP